MAPTKQGCQDRQAQKLAILAFIRTQMLTAQRLQRKGKVAKPFGDLA
jgi:hypothetical protein